MKRSRLKNKFFNAKTEIDRKAYNQQRNYSVTFIRKFRSNQTFFGNINATDVTDDKTFWRTVTPFFIDKVTTRSKITLIEKKEVQNDQRSHL